MQSRHFLTIRDFSPGELRELIALGIEMKAHPERYTQALEGKSLAMLFEKPSLRTRVSFDVGIQQLGGFSLYLSPSEVSLGKRESIADVARNLERMVQGIMVRTFAHSIVEEMARYSHVPVINGLTDFSHPCQALADFMTIQEVKGRLSGIKLAFLGDGNNVASSLLFTCARLGARFALGCPKGYELKPEVLRWLEKDGASTADACLITNDPTEAVKDADIVYTDVWASMGQEAQAEERKGVFRPYQVNEALLARAKGDAVFMHCLPAHRGEEVTAEVIDSPRSVVFQQAENRLHVQKAVMFSLMR
ncbi:MAG: ornithine carbamoyltransferase [Myxococcales bacterium]|nr:ornithine carbamoyltransferase [Myxococcales bacterium]